MKLPAPLRSFPFASFRSASLVLPFLCAACTVLLLTIIVTEILGLFISFRRGSLFAQSVLVPPFITAYWGAITHFVLAAHGRKGLRHYVLGFLMFSVLYCSVEFVVLLANGLVFGWSEPGDEWEIPWVILSNISLYNLLLISAGPLLWWFIHRVRWDRPSPQCELRASSRCELEGSQPVPKI